MRYTKLLFILLWLTFLFPYAYAKEYLEISPSKDRIILNKSIGYSIQPRNDFSIEQEQQWDFLPTEQLPPKTNIPEGFDVWIRYNFYSPSVYNQERLLMLATPCQI